MTKEMADTQAPEEDDDSTARLDRSVVLIGLMGAGKTSIGRLLAERLALPFIDADAEIERAAGATIEEIFVRDGEAAFRSGERRVIHRLLAGPPAVIATGGGAFMDDSTRAAVRERGISVWLKADLDTLVKRTARRGGRPLLNQGDPREILARLMAQRYPVYGEAEVTVETGEEPAETVTEAVIAALEAHLGMAPLAVSPGKKSHGPSKRRRNGANNGANNGAGNAAGNGTHRRRKNRRAHPN
jgi:shikimate kinase